VVAGLAAQATVKLNDRALGRAGPGGLPTRFEIADRLAAGNRLALEFAPAGPAGAEDDAPQGEIYLEIGPRGEKPPV